MDLIVVAYKKTRAKFHPIRPAVKREGVTIQMFVRERVCVP